MGDRARAETVVLLVSVAVIAALVPTLWTALRTTAAPAPKIVAKVDSSFPIAPLPSTQPAIVDPPTVDPPKRVAWLPKAAPPTKPPKRATAQPTPEPSAQQPIVSAQMARVALSSVGDDSDADAVWIAAINDPALPAEARHDLIEDLNEDGFADPEHVSIDELPLVMARIDLIEQLAPDAMDDVNEAAFAEAYKDLTNIARRLAR